MQFLATSWGRNDCNSIFHTDLAGVLLLHILQILQESGVRAEEMAGTNRHSVDQVVRLGSKEVEQLVEIDMKEVREVLAKVKALATTSLDQNGMYCLTVAVKFARRGLAWRAFSGWNSDLSASEQEIDGGKEGATWEGTSLQLVTAMRWRSGSKGRDLHGRWERRESA
jgi:hypothetical protein